MRASRHTFPCLLPSEREREEEKEISSPLATLSYNGQRSLSSEQRARARRASRSRLNFHVLSARIARRERAQTVKGENRCKMAKRMTLSPLLVR